MTSDINTLELKLNKSPYKKEKISLLNQLSEKIRGSNVEKSLKYSNEAVELANEISDNEGLAKALWNSGVCCRLLSKYDEAFQYFEKALDVYKKTNDVPGKAKVLNSIGNIYLNLSDYNHSLEYLKNSYEISRTLDDREFEARVLSNIGLVYQEMGDFTSSLEFYLKSMLNYNSIGINVPENLMNNIGIVYQNLDDYSTSLDYFFKSLKLAEENNNRLDKGFALGNIAIVYSKLNEYEKALKYLNESLEILHELGYRQAESNALTNIGNAYKGLGNYEKALEYQMMVLDIENEISDYSGRASTTISIGEIFYSLSNNELAMKYYLDGLSLSRKIGDVVNETKALESLGILHSRLNEPDKAISNLEKALELAESRNAKKDIADINKILYEIYKAGNNLVKAFEHHERHFNLEKEITNLESEKKLKSLSVQFQLQNIEKERKIALQEKEIYRLKNVELADANARLIKLNLEKNEFLGIAAHDLKNPISGILGFSMKIKRNYENYSKETICEMANEIEIASKQILELITKMLDINAIESGKRNLSFRHFDIQQLLEWMIYTYTERAEKKNIKFVFESTGVIEVFADRDATLQIVENLVSNAIKFSPTDKNIYINLTENSETVSISIKDEGPGLTEEDKKKLYSRFSRLSAQPTGGEGSTGLGLSIVKKLTEAMNGKISCESEKGKGAEFILTLPKYSGG